jgi:nitrogen-specific signal transduction histidine kinase
MRRPSSRSEVIEGTLAVVALAVMTGLIIPLHHEPWDDLLPITWLFPIFNAIEAMETTSDRSRLLRVKTELRDRKVVAVVVQDSGPGIDSNKLPDLFTALVSTKPHGMGLGLAISRMIIDYHGGKLTALSDGKDGASFEFVLPIASMDQAVPIR